MLDFINMIHWDALLKIVGIDLMLGVDNAIVIALACAALPEHLRARAMLLGTAAAVLLRAGLLLVADFVVGLPFLKIIAGAYLLYVGVKLLTQDEEGHDSISASDKMWGAIKTIIVADFMMSVDNVLGVVSAAHSTGDHSAMYAIGGIVLSIPIIIYGAKYLTTLMTKFPVIVWAGAGLLGWVGMEMIISDNMLSTYLHSGEALLGSFIHLAHKLIGFSLVVGTAWYVLKRKKNSILTTN